MPDQDDDAVLERVEGIRVLLDGIASHLQPDEKAIQTDGLVITVRRTFPSGSRRSVSHVRVIPLHPDQPNYVSQGLLLAAQDMFLDDAGEEED